MVSRSDDKSSGRLGAQQDIVLAVTAGLDSIPAVIMIDNKEASDDDRVLPDRRRFLTKTSFDRPAGARRKSSIADGP
jgi:hypothetical protein